MKDDATLNSIKLERGFAEGFKKGYVDALLGVHMKLLQHTRSMRSTYMQAWEEGYKKGYYEGLHEAGQPVSKAKTTSTGDL